MVCIQPSMIQKLSGQQIYKPTFVQQSRFQNMSSSILEKIDDMGNRIDDLEKSIAELMQQVGSSNGIVCLRIRICVVCHL